MGAGMADPAPRVSAAEPHPPRRRVGVERAAGSTRQLRRTPPLEAAARWSERRANMDREVHERAGVDIEHGA